MARWQTREEKNSSKHINHLTEKKNVMKHELKVPKAGQLDAVRASQIRKLSSNQLSGFRIRNTPKSGHISQDVEENSANHQSHYGKLESSMKKE